MLCFSGMITPRAPQARALLTPGYTLDCGLSKPPSKRYRYLGQNPDSLYAEILNQTAAPRRATVTRLGTYHAPPTAGNIVPGKAVVQLVSSPALRPPRRVARPGVARPMRLWNFTRPFSPALPVFLTAVSGLTRYQSSLSLSLSLFLTLPIPSDGHLVVPQGQTIYPDSPFTFSIGVVIRHL